MAPDEGPGLAVRCPPSAWGPSKRGSGHLSADRDRADFVEAASVMERALSLDVAKGGLCRFKQVSSQAEFVVAQQDRRHMFERAEFLSIERANATGSVLS